MQSTPIRDWIPEFPGLHKLIIPAHDRNVAMIPILLARNRASLSSL